MKNLKAISLSIVISGLLATTASALVSYPQRWYSGTCINISRDLSYHSRGSDVSQLQAFLVSKNFPGSGSWMQTGFFGAATQVAVRDFQQQENLSTSGIVDYQTREALSRITCDGLLAYGAPATPPYPTTIPWNGYGNGYPYNNGGLVSLNLTALSQNTGNAFRKIETENVFPRRKKILCRNYFLSKHIIND